MSMKKHISIFLRNIANKLCPAPRPTHIEEFSPETLSIVHVITPFTMEEMERRLRHKNPFANIPLEEVKKKCIEEAKNSITQGFMKTIKEKELIVFRTYEYPFRVTGSLYINMIRTELSKFE